MSTPTMAAEFAPIPDGFQVLDFTLIGTISDKWNGTMPDAKHFIIQPSGADLHWTADGSDPSGSVGLKMTDGSLNIFENQKSLLNDMKLSDCAIVKVHLFG